MKKILRLVLISICILVSGCTKDDDKYSNYEHYHFNAQDLNIHVYYRDGDKKEVYALADMTPEGELSHKTGLLYLVGDNDYILLETLEDRSLEAFKEVSVYQFCYDKLYGIRGDTGIFEVELNGTETKIKELNFEIDGEPYVFIMPRIKEVDINKIIISSSVRLDDGLWQSKKFDCSLIDYKCTMMEDSKK